jgi:hypothetical protein
MTPYEDGMLPDGIQTDVGALLKELEAAGLRVIDSRYDASVFGNYYVDLVGSGGSLRITRDRGYYHFGGDEDHLRQLGLFRSFEDLAEFREAVLAYARTVA